MKYLLSVISFLIIISCPTIRSSAQRAKAGHVLTSDEAKVVKKDAATSFSSGDFKGALEGYRELIKSDPKNPDFNYRLGLCYLMTSISKKEALTYLELGRDSKDAKKDYEYNLGMAYMYNDKFDEAITAFEKAKETFSAKSMKDSPTPDRLIEMCNNAKELEKHPVALTFSNPGKAVNSSYEEYNPCISADNQTLVFTSRRKGNIGGFVEDLGIYTADIYSSDWRDTVWSKARGAGGMVNTEWDEESTGISADGNQIFIYYDNVEYYADIGVSTRHGRTWQKPVLLPEKINTKQYEGSACISLDGNTLYFSSNRKEGSGGSDIWMVKKEAAGDWGSPVNLGSSINTVYDEDDPFITMDGNTLYFSSKGHNSMGGYDIFKSKRNPVTNTWSPAVNAGYPLNTTDDNTTISFTGDERYAWISCVRPDGLGDKDVWQVEYMDTLDHPFRTLIKGTVAPSAGGRIELTSVTLENQSDHTRMEYRPAGATKEFVLSALPGEYTLKVEGYNFAPYSENITIGNEFPPVPVIKNITVQSAK